MPMDDPQIQTTYTKALSETILTHNRNDLEDIAILVDVAARFLGLTWPTATLYRAIWRA
ncbi:hypothetical protein EJ02DRAFT_452954 [Clathrospora elynae]|uniref:Uncharacterized protein n=1 Tax=Clathrospora elynae TaxID=706981 RepID=A0A6A5SX70_9PLEO|nr:hypothetical protein EJ02DRAFT_452954 [Clathrospora elynae]